MMMIDLIVIWRMVMLEINIWLRQIHYVQSRADGSKFQVNAELEGTKQLQECRRRSAALRSIKYTRNACVSIDLHLWLMLLWLPTKPITAACICSLETTPLYLWARSAIGLIVLARLCSWRSSISISFTSLRILWPRVICVNEDSFCSITGLTSLHSFRDTTSQSSKFANGTRPFREASSPHLTCLKLNTKHQRIEFNPNT